MFEAINTEILGEIVNSAVGLLITFASQQHKLIPPRITIVRHELHEVLLVLTSCLRQYRLKYRVRPATDVGLLTTFNSELIPPIIKIVRDDLHDVFVVLTSC